MEVDGLRQPRSTRTQNNLAGLRLKENRFDEALTLYKRVVELDPLERDASPLYHVGQILLYQGQYAESAAYLTAAAAGYYSPLTTPPEEIWHDYGLALWFSGDVLKSLENFENAVMVNPVFPKGYNNLACAYGLGAVTNVLPPEALPRAIQSIEQALALDAGSALYWRNAAALLSFTGNMAGAQEAWHRAWSMFGDMGDFPQDCSWEFQFR